MDPASFRELQRSRHQARAQAANERALEAELLRAQVIAEAEAREQAELAAADAEARAIIEQRRQQDEYIHSLLSELEETLSFLETGLVVVESATVPGEVIPYLRQLSDRLQAATPLRTLPDDDRINDLITAIRATTARLIDSLNNNPRLIVQYGSIQMETMYTLMLQIGTSTGVEFELAPVEMISHEDERLARELQASMPVLRDADPEDAAAIARLESQYPREEVFYEPPVPSRVSQSRARANQEYAARVTRELREERERQEADRIRRQQASAAASAAAGDLSGAAGSLLTGLNRINLRLQQLDNPTTDDLAFAFKPLSGLIRMANTQLASYHPGHPATDDIATQINDTIDAIITYLLELDADKWQEHDYLAQLDQLQRLMGM